MKTSLIEWGRRAVAIGGVVGMGLVFFAHGHAQAIGAFMWAAGLLQLQESK